MTSGANIFRPLQIQDESQFLISGCLASKDYSGDRSGIVRGFGYGSDEKDDFVSVDTFQDVVTFG